MDQTFVRLETEKGTSEEGVKLAPGTGLLVTVFVSVLLWTGILRLAHLLGM